MDRGLSTGDLQELDLGKDHLSEHPFSSKFLSIVFKLLPDRHCYFSPFDAFSGGVYSSTPYNERQQDIQFLFFLGDG